MAERKRGPGRPRKDEIDGEYLENDARELDEIFADIPTNYVVKVYRNDPEWCAGYCGEFMMAAHKKLSVEAIKNRFGGRVFQLRIYGQGTGVTRQKTLYIDDVPKREGQELNRDGTVKSNAASVQDHPIESVLKMGLPPNITRQIIAFQTGQPDWSPLPDEKKPLQNEFGLQMQMQQMMMDMMNQNRQAQMQMQQQQFEMHRNMMQARQELEQSAKPKDPMNDVNTTIKLIRELNGIKTELGSVEHTSLATQVLEQTVPLVESALTEFLSYKKIQAQSQLNQNREIQASRQQLPPRIVAVNNSDEGPVQMAQKMADMYRNLSPSEQTEVMKTFMKSLEPENVNESLEENIVSHNEYDTIKYEDEELLTPEDRKILDANNQQNEADHISHGEHTGAAENNNTADRERDTGRFPLPTH